MSTNINWNSLNAATAGMSSVITQGQDRVEHIQCVGLRVHLSELQALLEDGQPAWSLEIFADTLVVDEPSLLARGCSIIARALELPAGSPTLLVPELVAHSILIGHAPSDSWSFALPEDPSAVVSARAGVESLRPCSITRDATGQLVSQASEPSAALPQWLGVPAALAALQASFSAASLLVAEGDDESRATARSMLTWIVSCCSTLTQVSASSDAFARLESQAGTLLVTIGVEGLLAYVPPFTASYYEDLLGGLIDALATYEEHARTLELAADISLAIAEVSASLASTSVATEQAYTAQLEAVERNIETLSEGVKALEGRYVEQQTRIHESWLELQLALDDQALADALNAGLDLAVSATKAGGAVSSSNPVNFVTELFKGVQAAQKMLDASSRTAPPTAHELLTTADALLDQQYELACLVARSRQLWDTARGNPSEPLTIEAGVVAVDPRIAWDSYAASSEAALIGPLGNSAQRAEAYALAAHVFVLAQLGMGIDANQVALVEQLASGTALLAQLRASQTITEQWDELREHSEDQEEQRRALTALVWALADDVKRSLFSSYELYKCAYLYSQLQLPPEQVSLDMSSAELRVAFSDITSWAAAATDGTITLPNEDVKLTLRFPVSPSAEEPGELAVLSSVEDGSSTLCFALPWASEQLAGVLPHGGQVAIWITAAEAYIEGAEPNTKGRIFFSLECSGAYLNGFDDELHTFVGSRLRSDFGYTPSSDGREVYIPWKVPTEVYAAPTPYTQWTISMDADGGDMRGASAVELHLRVSYMAQPGVGVEG